MDKILTNALDGLTLEEVEQITPKELSFELPAATPAHGAYLEIKK